MNSLDTNKENNELQKDEKLQDEATTVTQETLQQSETEENNFHNLSKQELYENLKSIVEQENDIAEIKDEVEQIKQQFYKKNKAEIAEQRAEFIEKGGNELDFIPATELEAEFKELLNQYRNKKAELVAEQEKEKENNLLKKNHIIDQMKQLVESNDDVSANISAFRQLQQDWKNTGQVPASAANELWKQYNLYQEQFWDLIKINNELREYDFKKNLEAKTKLIEQAEALADEEDVVIAFRQLQQLHDEWRELGPVARDLRDETWNKFKEASTVVNKKHQAHFEDLRKDEVENLELKTAICEKIEAIDVSKLETYKDWDDNTHTILELQEEWRKIGFAPRKSNQKIFERYRAACDNYFSAKSNFYKDVKSGLNQNLEKKKILCEKAEALKDSTDWKETSTKFIELQKEWKTIGAVPKKYSDEVWKRFITACDYFFEQRNGAVGGQKTIEKDNLSIKKALIEKIKNFKKSDDEIESLSALRGLAAEWNSIGHVPYKEKDKIYKEYREALDAQFDKLNIDASQRRLESFKSNLKELDDKDENKLYRERDKLVRNYEHLKSEITTYENNLGFFSSSSKKGDGMIKEMENKIEKLKEECLLIEQKIALIDEKI